MSQNIALLCSRVNKGKDPKEVTSPLNDLRDFMAFHQRVSVAMGTSLQHLADSLFVHLSNLILLRRGCLFRLCQDWSQTRHRESLAKRPSIWVRVISRCCFCHSRTRHTQT